MESRVPLRRRPPLGQANSRWSPSTPSQSVSSRPQPSRVVSRPSAPRSPATADRESSWQVAESLGQSFVYAGQGFFYAFRTQRNFRIHVAVTVVVLAIALVLHLPAVHLALISLTCCLVMVLELLNTALEAIVDLSVGKHFHPLAKIAKDCAAAAVLVGAAGAVGVFLFLVAPALLQSWKSWV